MTDYKTTTQSLLDPPEGDASQIRRYANYIAGLPDDLMDSRKILDSGMRKILDKWESTRSEMFSTAATGADAITNISRRQLKVVSQTLKRYAEKLEEAQESKPYNDLKYYDQKLSTIKEDHPLYNNYLAQYERAKQTILDRKKAAHEEAKSAEEACLDSIGLCKIPEHHPTANELLMYIIRNPGSAADQASERYAKLVSAMNLTTAPAKLGSGVTAAKAWQEHHKADVGLKSSYRQFREFSAHVYLRGGPTSAEAYAAAQEAIFEHRRSVSGKSPAVTRARTDYVDSLRPLTALARINAGVGIHDSIKTYKNPQHGGWRGDGDRAFAAISITASILELSLIAIPASGPLAPVVGTVALTLGTGAAAWEIGNLAYDNREEIKRTVEAPAELGREIIKDCKEKGLLNCPSAVDRNTNLSDRLNERVPRVR